MGKEGIRKGQCCNFKKTWWAVYSPTRPVVIPPSSLYPFLLHNPSLHPARSALAVLFPATTQWRHGDVGTEQHSVWLCACLSLWLIDNVGMLDNSDQATISHVSVCACAWERERAWDEEWFGVCEHAVSHFVRGLILCCTSVWVCHSVVPPLEEPHALGGCSSVFYTWT